MVIAARATLGAAPRLSVRAATAWDWKCSVLKKLSSEHAKARGWRIEAQANLSPKEDPRPGDLLIRREHPDGKHLVFWNNFYPNFPKFEELDTLLQGKASESAHFYIGYAYGDVLDCITWQLAEGHNDLAENPFVPLVHCYAAGLYPFSLDRATVVMFRFAANEVTLPRATLLASRT